MNIKNLIHAAYWFSQPEPAMGTVKTVWILALAGLCLGGIIALLARRSQAQNYARLILTRLGSFGLTLGVLGLAWFGFRQGGVFFLGWRLWIGAWLFALVIWGASILWYLLKRLPAIRAEHAEKERREKYLPRS